MCRLSHADFRATLIRINQIQRGWANYFKHAVAKHTFGRLHDFIWWRVVTWMMRRHRMRWKALSRRLRSPQGWRPIASEGIELFNLGSVSVTRYRWRGNHIPTPWPAPTITPAA
jgi:RNA-directed DNA polymerase